MMQTTQFPILSSQIFLSPYVWQILDDGKIQAMVPGAYLRMKCTGTSGIGIIVDRSINKECPQNSMPVVEWTIDGRPSQVAQISTGNGECILPLAYGLDSTASHIVEFFFRASNLCLKRWYSSATWLRLTAVVCDNGAILEPAPVRSKRAIVFGDSITEGVGVAKHFTGWNDLSANRATSSWCPIVCQCLDCEYGQLGTGGQGIAKTTENMPELMRSWSRYDENHSRLCDGKLAPHPDYVFCAMGTNDFSDNIHHRLDITDSAEQWLCDVRNAAPDAWIFWVEPPLGVHSQEIKNAVTRRSTAGDKKVASIDTSILNSQFSIDGKATPLADDGVHPNAIGTAYLAATIMGGIGKKTIFDS